MKMKAFTFLNVEVPLFVYFVAFGMFIPAQQRFIYQSLCKFKFGKQSSQICPFIDKSPDLAQQEDEVQADYAVFSTWSSICLYPAAMVTTVVMGTWCDRLSHRMPLVIANIGNVLISLVYLIYAYVPQFNENVNPKYLALASLLPGLCGYQIATNMAAASYVGTSSSTKHRTLRVGLIQTLVPLGQSVGFLADAFIFSNKGLLPFLVQIAANIYAIATIFVFVTELRTLQEIRSQMADEDQARGSWCRYLCAPHLIIATSAKTVFSKHKLRVFRVLMLLTYAVMAALVGPFSLQAVQYDFLTLLPISLSQASYALFMATFAGSVGVGGVVLLPFVKALRLSDPALGILGMISAISSLIILGFGDFYPKLVPWLFCISTTMGVLPFVSLKAGLSKIYEPSEQGRLFAILGLFEYTIILLASLAFNSLYATLVTSQSSLDPTLTISKIIHGYTFLFVAGLCLIPTILIISLGNQKIPNWSFYHVYNKVI